MAEPGEMKVPKQGLIGMILLNIIIRCRLGHIFVPTLHFLILRTALLPHFKQLCD